MWLPGCVGVTGTVQKARGAVNTLSTQRAPAKMAGSLRTVDCGEQRRACESYAKHSRFPPGQARPLCKHTCSIDQELAWAHMHPFMPSSQVTS